MSTEPLILDDVRYASKQELNCPTMGIDFSDEVWKEQINQFKGLDLQFTEIKDLCLNLFRCVGYNKKGL